MARVTGAAKGGLPGTVGPGPENARLCVVPALVGNLRRLPPVVDPEPFVIPAEVAISLFILFCFILV